ncbi:hypothetical protein 2050HW_00289 [Serratia phage vB_SmaM_ 2050HW]|uniref:Uncharacterized protein n=1 Tax=Serratia phage vB_SmaM_ 2050HW TaxID=2024252 RepID=A0A289ZU24_9CAUD|nr:hypothetical protein HWB23_gp289 [Serratia phage vB_SmaM_ 2050HW]ATA65624.1 hypothetical protein 2050HW_00289 [Serratia phage vB_SmaM_ 2050HW]UCR74562.1 hypothetical protein [Serratia phage BUCT660]UQT03743.1 hypothetical protein KODAMA_02760 [Serratia phage vB_SmaM-Kodama]URG14133.1 hypothetical protein [Pectobacterium phage vB_ParM-25]
MKDSIKHAFRTVLETYRTEIEPSRVISDHGGIALFHQFETDLPEEHIHTAALINITDHVDLFDIDPLRGICLPCALFVTAYMQDVYGYDVVRQDLKVPNEDFSDSVFLHTFILEDGLHFDTCYVEGLRYIHDHPLLRQFDEDEDWWLSFSDTKEDYGIIHKGTELSDFFVKCADLIYPAACSRTEFKKIFLN